MEHDGRHLITTTAAATCQLENFFLFFCTLLKTYFRLREVNFKLKNAYVDKLFSQIMVCLSKTRNKCKQEINYESKIFENR